MSHTWVSLSPPIIKGPSAFQVELILQLLLACSKQSSVDFTSGAESWFVARRLFSHVSAHRAAWNPRSGWSSVVVACMRHLSWHQFFCVWVSMHSVVAPLVRWWDVFWFALFGRDLHLYDCRACQEHLWPLPVACHAVFLFPAAVYQVSLALARRAFRPVPNRRELPWQVVSFFFVIAALVWGPLVLTRGKVRARPLEGGRRCDIRFL